MRIETRAYKMHKYMDLAELFSTWSKDPRTKVGAVIVGGKGQILAQGYNGFPRGFPDLKEYYADREVKHTFVVHAEANCIYNASLTGTCLEGSTIYISGMPPCRSCTQGIIQVGIKEVVIYNSSIDVAIGKGYTTDHIDSFHMLEKCGVKLTKLKDKI